MRNHDVSPSTVDENEFKKLGSVPLSRRSPEERQSELNDVLTWLRNKKPDSMDPSGQFKKIDQMLPRKKNQRTKDRANDIESALDWCRNNGVRPGDEDGNVPGFNKIGSVPGHR